MRSPSTNTGRETVWRPRTSVCTNFVLAASLCLSPAAYATDRPDAWITTKLKIALLTTRGLSASNIHVDTIDGRVTLYGIASSPAEQARAEQVAKSVQGAREVRDLLQVVPSQSQAGRRLRP